MKSSARARRRCPARRDTPGRYAVSRCASLGGLSSAASWPRSRLHAARPPRQPTTPRSTSVRGRAGERVDGSPARIGGCSYGGWVSLEVYLRAPHRFAAWAGVQTAIGRDSAGAYAERLARLTPAAPLLIETSAGDPFHDANVALAGALAARDVRRDLIVLPGPHGQPWLREAGTPSAVAWLDRT